MSDNQRWRHGDAEPVLTKPVPTATVINIGDLVLSTPAKAEGMADNSAFLGVAAQRSLDGDTDAIRVHTGGVHEFDCDAGTWDLGDLVTVHATDSQKVVAGVAGTAVGRVAKQYDSNTTTVLVKILSKVMSPDLA